MSDLEQLSNIIMTILSSNNEARKESEALLKKTRQADLNKYVYVFLNLLNESPKVEVRMFCAVHLRSVLSSFAGASLESSWIDLNSETQKIVKESLFELLNKEPDRIVRKGLCDLIGELGATISTFDESDKPQLGAEAIEWDALMQNLMHYLSSNNNEYIICALKILSVLFLYSGDNYVQYKSELMEIFKKNLENEDIFVKAAAIQALASFLETIDARECKPYAELIPTVLANTVQIIHTNEDLGVEVLSHIQDIVETEHRIFKSYFKQLFEAMKAINEKKIESPGIKESSLEIMVIFLEKSPKFGQNHQDILKELLEMIFTYMVVSEENPDEEWMKPPEGFVETEKGETEEPPIKFSMHLIDKLISCLGETITIPLLSKIILQMVKIDDWRYKHAALMALSQVGEYVSDVVEMDPIVQFILNFISDMHPKVRYAALHAIGQISDDMHPEFQQRFHTVVLGPLIASVKDSVPRVAAHALAALTNFLEGAPKAAVAGKIAEILELCLQFLHNGISLIKENAMSTISALAEASHRDFTQYWQSTAETVFNILKTATQKEYKQLRGQAIECLTLIGAAVGKEEFKKAAHEIIQCMLEIQQGNVEESDPQKSYLLSGWQRVCIILKEDFIPYLDAILPSLFDMVEEIIKNDEKRRFGNEEDQDFVKVQSAFTGKPQPRLNVNTSETEDLKIALNMINNFVVELRKGYLNYVERTSSIIEPLMDYSSNEEIRITAAKCFPGLIRVVKESGHVNAPQIVKNMVVKYLNILWETISSEAEPRVMAMLTYSMREIIHIAGRCLNEGEVRELSERIYKALKSSDERIQTKEQWANEDDIDQDEIEELEDDAEMEEELQVALAGLIGALFATHKELNLPFVQTIFKEILPKALDPSMSPRMHKFGLFLIDDMIEHLGVELIPNEWPHLSEALMKFATSKYCEVRQAAVYGIGVLAEKSKESFKVISEYCLKAIYESLNVQKGPEELAHPYGQARDHCIVALGKIIKNQSDCVPNLPEVVKLWVDNLPIKFEKKEARAQHELLLDIILTSNASLIFGEKGENMPHVVKIFAEIVNTKLSTDAIKTKILQVIQLLASNEGTQTLLKNAIAGLEEKLQNKLKEVIG